MTGVVICDPPTPLRRVLAERVAAVPQVDRIQLVDDPEGLLPVVAGQRVDVLLLSSRPGDVRASEVVGLVRERSPGTRVLLLTLGTDPDEVVAGIAAGAVGYLARDAAVSEVAAALALLPQPAPVLPRPTGPAAARLPRAALTDRELQVLQGMSRGRSNGQIGDDLFLSEDTIKTHARRLFRKLQVNDRAHAVAEGFRRGLLE